MTTTERDTQTLATLKLRVAHAIDLGLIGLACDEDALRRRLNTCQSVEEIDAFRRMVTRWEYAVEPKQDWMTYDELYEMTRN